MPEANLGAGYEQVSLTTSDGLELAGWYVPSRNGAAVIAFPGRNGPQAHTRMLARHGYGVLLFDRRGQGESEGDPHGFGWEGEKDIKAAIEFLQRRPDVDPERIGGLGLSVGGELMLQAAAETDALKAVVSEGAGSRSVGEFREMPGAPIDHARRRDHDHRRAHAVLQQPAAAAHAGHHRPDRAATGVPHLGDARRRHRGAQPRSTSRRPAGPRRSGRSPRPSTSAGSRRGRRSTSDASSGSSTARYSTSAARNRACSLAGWVVA